MEDWAPFHFSPAWNTWAGPPADARMACRRSDRATRPNLLTFLRRMACLLRTVLLAFVGCLVLALWLWWELQHIRSGCPPDEPGFLKWWYDLEGQPELDLFLIQLGYPVFWWFTRNPAWTGSWGWLRKAHGIAAIYLVLALLLLFLATPDVSGFTS